MSSCKGIAAFSKTGIGWIRSDKRLPEDDLYIRWGCTANVPTNNVLNTAEAIHRVNDKKAFRMLLNEHELCPYTFDLGEGYRNLAVATFPAVIRPKKHAQGKHTYLVEDWDEYGKALVLCQDGYGSEYIKKVSEYRIFVVQGRVACVAQKTPDNPDAIAWNVAKGGRFDNVRFDDWPLRACKTAIEAFMLSGLDFGGVDVMLDAEGKPYVLEINSAPSLTSPYRQECMAKCFDYIVEHGKASIPLIEEKGGYRKFIHPAVSDRAQLVEDDLPGIVNPDVVIAAGEIIEKFYQNDPIQIAKYLYENNLLKDQL